MRSLRFLPLVFIIGADGFAMFVPYLLLVWMAAFVIERHKSSQPRPAVVTA